MFKCILYINSVRDPLFVIFFKRIQITQMDRRKPRACETVNILKNLETEKRTEPAIFIPEMTLRRRGRGEARTREDKYMEMEKKRGGEDIDLIKFVIHSISSNYSSYRYKLRYSIVIGNLTNVNVLLHKISDDVFILLNDVNASRYSEAKNSLGKRYT